MYLDMEGELTLHSATVYNEKIAFYDVSRIKIRILYLSPCAMASASCTWFTPQKVHEYGGMV